MSQIPTQGEVGRLHVTISAEGTSQVKSELNSVGVAGQEAAAKSTSAFKAFGKSLSEPVHAITRIIGALTGAVGVALTFYEIGKKIRETFESGAEKAQKMVDALATADASDKVKKLNEELQQLDAILANRLDVGTSLEEAIFGESTTQIQDKIKELRKERDAALASVNQQREAQRKRAEQKKQEDEDKANADKEEAAREKKMRDDAETGAKKQTELFDRLVNQYAEEREAREKRITEEMKKQTAELERQVRIREQAQQALLSAANAADLGGSVERIARAVEAIRTQRNVGI